MIYWIFFQTPICHNKNTIDKTVKYCNVAVCSSFFDWKECFWKIALVLNTSPINASANTCYWYTLFVGIVSETLSKTYILKSANYITYCFCHKEPKLNKHKSWTKTATTLSQLILQKWYWKSKFKAWQAHSYTSFNIHVNEHWTPNRI